MRVNLFDYYRKSPIRQTEYVVKQGDTLYNIAKNHGVTVKDLMKINDLHNTLIYPDQVLVIPKSVPSGAMYFMEYVVTKDDTLEKISKQFDVPTEEIGRYNDVTKLILAEGQVLTIPTRYKVYTVKDGDSLSTILRNTNMTQEEFINANIDNLIKPGMTVYVK
ncbi:MAG TPA: LysM peptidoglycan-binding domain-containing protein [Acholeplasmataceae bacterium]|jgi:LysM repeat protein|nr:LysM peptidoglycan-binding domain-containing protein [Acholeplasmataceae bacterium]